MIPINILYELATYPVFQEWVGQIREKKDRVIAGLIREFRESLLLKPAL